MSLPEVTCDVAVLGGGLAGLAVATSLARKGVHVVCVEPKPDDDERVGESLDWSSPQLLEELGFDRAGLIERRCGTWKRHIRVMPDEGEAFELAPRPWFAWRPWRLELETLHLDRGRFDRELLARARDAGVELRSEKVLRVLVDGQRVEALQTASARVRARRYVDASGRAHLLARAFEIPAVPYGPPKVSLWTYLPAPAAAQGTTLYLGCTSEYLSWTWEIPVADDVLSLGLTLPAEALKQRLARHAGPAGVLRAELERHARLRALLPDRAELAVRTCSFQCLVHERTSGPNWLLVGEAGAMVDPLTSHGFTAALRFGSHAAALIARSLEREALPSRDRRVYDGCLQSTARAFNRHIERAAYRPAFRKSLGTYRATLCYVLFGYFVNALYQKLRPRTFWRAQVMHCILCGFEVWFGAWALAARLRPRGGLHAAA